MAEETGGGAITDVLQSRAGLAAIFTALVGLLMHSPSDLNSSRPEVEANSNKSYEAVQDVDARLWQDPFEAVKEAAKDTIEIKGLNGKYNAVISSDAEKQDDHTPERIYSDLPAQMDGSKITLMAVMMSAAPMSEEREARLRRRYALVSALANREYAPVNAEHIGYFRTADAEHIGLPQIVPFEWFEKPQKIYHQNNGTDAIEPARRVLVLWVDDSQSNHVPVKKILALLEQAKPSHLERITRIVMGPNSSDHLKAMAMEIDNKNYPEAEDIKFYSALATATDCNILNNIDPYCKTSLVDYLSKRHIHLARTIADDETVTNSLVEELKERHVMDDKARGSDKKEGDHIVLLSDWDTLYGRSLPLTFEKAYEHEPEVKCSPLDKFEEHVHCFKYIRGIDGILPGTAQKEEKPTPQTKAEPGAAPPEPTDHPDGMSQKDYLRRAVEEIRMLDANLLHDKKCYDPSKRCGVAAIGVLGYDVYDKLMILRALRPYFPNKIFFTTDLNAAYWTPTEAPYTHNLLVASSFGLSLNPPLQKGIPPFRDSYQTAFFFSTLMALDKIETVKDRWIDTPRIFEIGRNGPVDLSAPKERGLTDEEACEGSLSACITAQPLSFAELPRSHEATLKWLLGITAFLLLYLTSWNVRKWTNQLFLHEKSGNSTHWFFNLASKLRWGRIGMASTVMMGAWLIVSSSKEPFLWFEGVSIWPSEILRFIALIACWVLLHDGRQRIAKGDEEIAKEFGLGEKTSATSNGESDKKESRLQYFSSVLKWQNGKNKTWLSTITPQEIYVNKLWEEYRLHGKFKRRICRSLKGFLVFILFAWFAMVLSGGLTIPARGEVAFIIDKLLIVTVALFMLLLTMLVVDAARLCAAFITHLSETQSNWEAGSNNLSCEMIQRANQWGLDGKHTAYWLDIQFVAQRTVAIQRLIWYPIIPIFLLVIARSPIFDDWSHPIGLEATLAILVAYLISCAFWLERGAKKMRDKATRKLGEELIKLRGVNCLDPKIARLENMIQEIKEIKEGAFLPLFKQPWVEAILTLASGAGGLTWLGNFLGAP